MLYNIYYINFDKVYEIKMMLSNVISKGGEIQSQDTKGDEDEVKAKIGAKFLNFFSAEVGGDSKSSQSSTKKVLETFEIKMTKSIILNEIIHNSILVNEFSRLTEGELIKIDNVNLSLENEAELRTVKLFANGSFKGLVVPAANGLDLNNIVNAMMKDYSYKMKGVVQHGEDILIKIPLSFENEFESSYSVDDLFIGKVSIVGIYKGKINLNSLKNSFQFFQELGSHNQMLSISDNEIQESQYESTFENKNRGNFISSNEDKEYHYIDLLAIIQNVKTPEPSNGD